MEVVELVVVLDAVELVVDVVEAEVELLAAEVALVDVSLVDELSGAVVLVSGAVPTSMIASPRWHQRA